MEELGKEIDKLSNKLTALRWELWTEHVVFTWKWWMLVFLCILFSVIFVLFIRKDNLLQNICYFGIVYVINRNFDDIATVYDWYDYRIQLEPLIPTMLPANLFIIPISLTLIYQKFITWKEFLIALLLYAGFISFIALPMMRDFGFYLIKNWNGFYSLLSLLVIASLTKMLVDLLVKLQLKRR
jgi:hypothetical protein